MVGWRWRSSGSDSEATGGFPSSTTTYRSTRPHMADPQIDALSGPGQPRMKRNPLATVAVTSVAAIGFSVLVVMMILIEASGEAAPEPSIDPETLLLPLDPDAVGFEGGATEPAADSDGPLAPSYCNNVPEAGGLLAWRGNRLTDETGRRRLAQSIARFATSDDAGAYVEANSTIIDCASWQTTADDRQLRFEVIEVSPETIFGDETKRFDVQATVDGPDLFLQTLLVRSGRDVAQFTFVSANRQDLAQLDELVARAVVTLGYG